MITTADVAAYLGLPDDQDPALPGPVAASNGYVAALPHVADPWDDRTTQGAIMLAARLYRRRNTPAGVESYAGEGAVYVARTDPDVAVLLRVGIAATPRAG